LILSCFKPLPSRGFHYRQLILLIGLLLPLSACSLRPDPQQVLSAFADKEFEAVKTDLSRLAAMQAILSYRSLIHNEVYTFSYYANKNGVLHHYRGQNLQLLWRSQLLQFDLTIQYDDTLQPCAEQLQKEQLAQYFPAEYLMSGSQRLPLSIVLTGQSSFATLNPIDPQNPKLSFVFRYSCKNSDPAEVFGKMVELIYHETMHYFQHLDSRHYDRYYPERKKTARQRAILWEAVAVIHGKCAQILNPRFTSILIKNPTAQSRLVLAEIPDNAMQHSKAGELFAILWFIRFIDNEGFIHKTNTAQYEQVRAACSADSSDLIQQAAAIVAERVVAEAPAE
jgi:hypothetical protein